MSHSLIYYPGGNGLAESSNKIFVNIIEKATGDNKRRWDNQLNFSQWVVLLVRLVGLQRPNNMLGKGHAGYEHVTHQK